MIYKLCFLFILSFNAFGFGSNNKIKSIDIQSESDSNNSMAVELDIVFVYDKEVNKILSEIDEVYWFGNKNLLMMNYSAKLKVMQNQIPPYYLEEKVELPKKHKKAYGVYLYVNMMRPNTYSCDIKNYKKLKINIKSDSVELKSL